MSNASSVLSGGVRVAVEVIGEGEPVTVVGHGLTQTRRDLVLLAPFLPGTKVLFDFRGHGESERPGPGHYSMDDFASDVDNVAAAFGATCVAGTSLGAGATLRLLCHRPDRFEELVVILPARLRPEARAGLLHLADLLEAHPLSEVAEIVIAEEEAAGRFDGFPASKELRRRSILAMNREGMPLAIRGCIDDPPIRDPEPIRQVTATALVIAQEGDPVHDADVARELTAMLPRAELVLFPDRYSLIREIPAVVSRVSAFLADRSPPCRGRESGSGPGSLMLRGFCSSTSIAEQFPHRLPAGGRRGRDPGRAKKGGNCSGSRHREVVQLREGVRLHLPGGWP
jgi:pimeloyl-ACP methyl ester carboxylesterase